METRPIHEIACEIRQDWKRVYFGAVPYLEAMELLNGPNDLFFADDGYTVIRYFLANAATWKGETAKRVKAELKAMVKGGR